MNGKITVDPLIHFGKPCVAGTRITVQDVLELINAELSFDEIKRDYYPELEKDDFKACMNFAMSLISYEAIIIAG